MLDVFNQDAFSVISLTDRANNPDIVPFVPGRIGELGLFTETGIRTTTVAIERRNRTLELVPDAPRGGPAKQGRESARNLTSFRVPHLPYEDVIQADEIQGIRTFGEEDQLEAVQEVVDQRMIIMSADMDATLEHLRMGALKGVILDADGSTELFNLFTEFGVSQPSEVNFQLDVDTTDVRGKCSQVIRGIEDALGNATYTGIHAFCSSEFFDSLVAHAQVREAYDRWQNGEFLRMRTARRMFLYGGIMFEEYRGTVGGTRFIAANKVRFFPVGVRGLFVTHFAPADFIETVNTQGLPRYVKQAVDQKFQRFVDLHMQSNPLPMCTRPEVLFRGRTQ